MSVILGKTYRLSHARSDNNPDVITYNRMILYRKPTRGGVSLRLTPYFNEGFNAREFIVEGMPNANFRKQTLIPQMLYDFDRLRIIGDELSPPQLRSKLSITPAPMGLKVNEESDVFSVKFRDVDASHGSEVEAYNSTSLGTNTNIEFYDRDVRRISRERNMLGDRKKLTPTPPPEALTEKILEVAW